MMDYPVAQDIGIIEELLNISAAELAEKIDVSAETISRWNDDCSEVSRGSIEKIYDFAFREKLKINKINEQLLKEECKGNHMILFHGAKNTLDGKISIEKSKENNDFGRGFYCGESSEQSAMFVSGYKDASLYIFDFDSTGLNRQQFPVDREWMLAIAYFRGRLAAYEEHPLIREIRQKVYDADYVIAPIADNRMYEIINSFIEGEITDIQCRHCLSATDLGNQYVFRTEKALKQIQMKRRCYLCSIEKAFYLDLRMQDSKTGYDKVRIARKQYRGQGKYIEEILI